MKTFYDATVDCNKDQAQAYEWVKGDFERGKDGEFVRDDDGLLIPTNPIHFPLAGCLVQHNGGSAQISVAVPGEKNLIIDRLRRAPEPKESRGKGGEEVATLTGLSEMLLQQGVPLEDATVEFTVKRWAAEHHSGERAAG